MSPVLLAADLVAIAVLVFGLFVPRHHRRDLVVAFLVVNVAVLAVMATLSALLSAAELTFESERALEVALQLYRDGSADVADGLHIALAAQAGELPLWTFDRRAARLRGAARIEG